MIRAQLNRAGAVSLLVASMTMSLSATAAEGLYSAEDLIGADVYNSAGEEIGDVKNILLGNDMSVHALVVSSGKVLGMGGREIVAERGTFTVRPSQESAAFDDIEYEVHMDTANEAMKDLPEYSEDWWDRTRDALVEGWENTRETTESAWESTKEATASAWQNIREGADEAGDEAEDAVD